VRKAPYGIREKTKRIGHKKDASRKLKAQQQTNDTEAEQNDSLNLSDQVGTETRDGNNNRDSDSLDDEACQQATQSSRVPQCKRYLLSEIFMDLLEFSSQHLEVGGRLVYWLPIVVDNRNEIK